MSTYLSHDEIPLVDVRKPERQAAIQAILERYPVNPDPSPEVMEAYYRAVEEWHLVHKAYTEAINTHREAHAIRSERARAIAVAELEPIPECPPKPTLHVGPLSEEKSGENSTIHAVWGVYEELFDYDSFGTETHEDEVTVTMPGLGVFTCLEGGCCHDAVSTLGLLFQEISYMNGVLGDAPFDEFYALITRWRDEDYPWLANNESTLAESSDGGDEEVAQ